LIITQKLDPTDAMLGFFCGWVRALAARTASVDVLTLEAARWPDAPGNVRAFTMGKAAGVGRLRLTANFYRALLRLVSSADAIIAHMVPRYALMTAPLAALRRKPILLWYTHRSLSRELRLALAVSRFAATAVPSSFPLPHPKVRALGHGVDADFYAPEPSLLPNDPPLIVHVARLAPIKRQDVLIRAAAQLGDVPFQLAFIGPASDAEYAAQLQQQTIECGLSARVTFTGGLPPITVRGWLRQATVAVNLSAEGLFDKAALESMLCAVPTVVSSAAFSGLLGAHAPQLQLSDGDDAPALAARLRALLTLSAAERTDLGAALRARTAALHSLDRLADRLVALCAEAAR
jgi:glycosyltransferase involved in cell wall biosynthesis